LERSLPFSLTFKNNRTLHEDLILEFAGKTWISDTYFFALDESLKTPYPHPLERIYAVLRRLLTQWLTAVETLQPSATVYLPYDFSDQCTAWLACTKSGDTNLTIRHGWSNVEGWSFLPTEIGPHLHHLPDFMASGPTLETTCEQMLTAIRTAIQQASQSPANPC
jgi:hypothetical protein